MGEPQVKERKVVGKNVAIALGIVCIVLLASLIASIFIFSLKNTDLQDQVDDLNAIMNGEKTVAEVWVNNKTFTLNPNTNVSKWVITPHSGDLKVECYIEPESLNIWVNMSWSVYYSYPPRLYQVYPTPFIDNANSYYIEEEFPVVSFAQGIVPNVGVIIGNNSTDTVTTVRVTITSYY